MKTYLIYSTWYTDFIFEWGVDMRFNNAYNHGYGALASDTNPNVQW